MEDEFSVAQEKQIGQYAGFYKAVHKEINGYKRKLNAYANPSAVENAKTILALITMFIRFDMDACDAEVQKCRRKLNSLEVQVNPERQRYLRGQIRMVKILKSYLLDLL